MYLTVTDTLDRLPRDQWNALAGSVNPFIRHEFLSGLENTGCVGNNTGWEGTHLLLYADRCRQKLVGAVPMYLKYHSYGEYVFDWAWADAYQRAGLEYYPKLLVAIPFTPVVGPRILASTDSVRDELISAMLDHAQNLGVSSLHCLFTDQADMDALQQRGLLCRMGTQFHWRNDGYASFDDYLQAFTASKRKKIKRERRRVREAGIEFEIVSGDQLRSQHWDAMYRFYRTTILEYGAIPYLTHDFFATLGRDMANQTVLVFAHQNQQYVAGAMFLRDQYALYGRYWGALHNYNGLHFETCYYRAIEYCIDHKIERFEAGAQGEHKLSRGLLPMVTYSLHWLKESRFATAVADYLDQEHGRVIHYRDVLAQHSPFRNGK